MSWDRPIDKTMLGDITWVHQQLKTMKGVENRRTIVEYVGRSIDFVKGVLWERERASKILLVNENCIRCGSILYQGETNGEKAKSDCEDKKS